MTTKISNVIDDINDATGYANGVPMTTEAEVRAYFTVENMRHMFGFANTLEDQADLDEMAQRVINMLPVADRTIGGIPPLDYMIPDAVKCLVAEGRLAELTGPFCPEFGTPEGRTLYVDVIDPKYRTVPSGARYSVMDESGTVVYADCILADALSALIGGPDAEHVTVTAHTAIEDAFGTCNDDNDCFLHAIPLESHVGEEIEKAIARVIALEFDIAVPSVRKAIMRAVIEQARVLYFG